MYTRHTLRITCCNNVKSFSYVSMTNDNRHTHERIRFKQRKSNKFTIKGFFLFCKMISTQILYLTLPNVLCFGYRLSGMKSEKNNFNLSNGKHVEQTNAVSIEV